MINLSIIDQMIFRRRLVDRRIKIRLRVYKYHIKSLVLWTRALATSRQASRQQVGRQATNLLSDFTRYKIGAHANGRYDADVRYLSLYTWYPTL